MHTISCSMMCSSFQIAKRYVESALDYSTDILIGGGSQGPFDHLMKLKTNALNQCVCRPFDPSNLLLYAVTDSKMNKKWARSMSDAVKAAIEGGATIIQLRFVLNALVPFSLLVYIFDFESNIWILHHIYPPGKESLICCVPFSI